VIKGPEYRGGKGSNAVPKDLLLDYLRTLKWVI
jgi:hypothetical protein